MSPLLISKFFNEHFVNLISQIYQARNSDTKKKKKKIIICQEMMTLILI